MKKSQKLRTMIDIQTILTNDRRTSNNINNLGDTRKYYTKLQFYVRNKTIVRYNRGKKNIDISVFFFFLTCNRLANKIVCYRRK